MARQKPRMEFTRARDLWIGAFVGAFFVYLAAVLNYSAFPQVPVFAGTTLLLVAAVDLALAVNMRPRVRHQEGTTPVEALTAARAVALAKASALAGAILAGAWLGLLLYVLPRMSVIEAARSDALAAGIGALSAGALVAAGLWLERCLRNPDEPDEPEEFDDEEE